MYQKIPQKQVTYRSPKNDEKQLDYILLDKKHITWSRDAESTDILHMGSDHRCVMARFEITAKEVKGKPRKTKAPTEEHRNETNEEGKQQDYMDIEQEVKETELKKKNTEGEAGEATNISAKAATKGGTTEAEGRKADEASAAQSEAAGNQSISKRKAEATDGTAATAGMTETTDALIAHAAAALDVYIETRQAVAMDGSAAQEEKDTNEKDEKIRALIQKRKNTAKNEKEKIREISKEIKKNIRENKRMKRQEKIQKILEKVKGTRNIPSIKSVKRRILIPKIRNKEGEAEKTRQGIANVFAKFYEELYKGEDEQEDESKHAHIDQENVDSSQEETIPEFTKEEIQAAIHRLKKGKAKDNSGVRAEQLKICSEETKEKNSKHLQ